MVRRRAVGGPTGVGDAERPARRLGGDQFRQALDAAFSLAQFERAVGPDAQTRGIVPAVFEPTQPFEQQGRRLTVVESAVRKVDWEPGKPVKGG